ncbi:MAG: hypothetical protein A2018_06590 [Alphaproteobacteria bacterium GWF2_58_20]|nr:MAG: hypothetical protein A2018_06590 [Alphaproteobacteria bacterium GWF2_58_20]
MKNNISTNNFNKETTMTSFMKKLLGTTGTRERGAIGGIPEQVIAIAVGVIVVSGMVALGSRAFTSSKVNTEIANLNSITNGARSLYSGMVNYNGITQAQLISASAIPQSMVSGTTIRNAWGGTIAIAADDINAGYTVTSNMYPKEVCIDLITKTPASGYYRVTVQGTVLADTLDASTTNDFPISPARAVTACNAGNNQNTIIWAAR